MSSSDSSLSVFQLLQPVLSGHAFDVTVARTFAEFEQLATIQTFDTGQLVFAEGHAPAKVWIIEEGRAVLTIPTTPGRKPLDRLIKPGDILGITETLAGVPFRTTLRTLTPCSFQVLEHDSLVRFLRGRPELQRQLLDALAEDYVDALQQLADVVSCDLYHIPTIGSSIEWDCDPKTSWINRN